MTNDISLLEKGLHNAHQTGDRKTIEKTLKNLYTIQKKLDWWFEKYIEMFDDKIGDMNVKRSEPVKMLYNHKFRQYQQASALIFLAKDYLLPMTNDNTGMRHV